MENVPTGGIKIKAKEFGLFCYDEGVAYDPKNEFKGLFRSPLLVRVSDYNLFTYVSLPLGFF
jgi:hypothetical protein